MTWWLWVVLGLVLAAIELATPGGFFVIFFGVAALVVGGLEVAGLARPAWLQWLLFTVIAIVALRLFRQPLLSRIRMRDGDEVDSLRGEVAVVAGGMAPGEHGRAELRGSMPSSFPFHFGASKSQYDLISPGSIILVLYESPVLLIVPSNMKIC